MKNITVQYNTGKEDVVTLIPTIVYQRLDWSKILGHFEDHMKHTFFFKFLKYHIGITFNVIGK